MVDAQEPSAEVVLPLIWATSLCYAMKLVAHVGQQKIFGERLAQKASVRAMVSLLRLPFHIRKSLHTG